MIRLHRVSYRYPFQKECAIKELSLSIRPGTITLVTGRSGCGKSTLIRLINGLAPHHFRGELQGEVTVCGSHNSTCTVGEIATRVGTLFQDPASQFFTLSVEEEIAFALEWRGLPSEEIQARLHEAATLTGIGHLLKSEILHLSEGEKQRVALASVMALRPKVIILDEPSANLDPEATRELARTLSDLAAKGTTIFIVDHRLYWLKEVATQVVVMEHGRIAVEGLFSILESASLRRHHGLREVDVVDPIAILPAPPDAPDGIEVVGLTFGYKKKEALFRDFSCRLPKGAVTALVGSNGVGKTTFIRLLTGLESTKTGRFTLHSIPITPDALLKESAVVLQNSDHQLHMKSVRQELETAHSFGRKNGLFTVEETATHLGLAPLLDRHPQSLSGGEKQRLVIACGLVQGPSLLVLDEPTSGLDGENMRLFAELMQTATDTGISVVLISHDLELLSRVCQFTLHIQKKAPHTVERPERRHTS